ncbi:Expansin-like EG45 domain-containing protein [Mycena indigotica]|uniref:Conserved oligomeric Golgi complex subunit 7 n=1 Tax=Mycena indigotica TaxID=2126181 RepID=A0A8H6WG67_9AGAR|nr:Expansin-like EG45 domain-containing protein [Mycena indigotica]KAF7315511.1 Expansin-like EG45 domain-containing protein [Mycena indigotica]
MHIAILLLSAFVGLVASVDSSFANFDAAVDISVSTPPNSTGPWIDFGTRGTATMTHYEIPDGYIASCGCTGASTKHPTAAMSQMAYGSSNAFGKACGYCFNLTLLNSYTGTPPFFPNVVKSIVVKVTDLCPLSTYGWCAGTAEKKNPGGQNINFDLAYPSSSIPADFFPSNESYYGYKDFGVWNITYEVVSCSHWAGWKDAAALGSVTNLGTSVCCPANPTGGSNDTCPSFSDANGIPPDTSTTVASAYRLLMPSLTLLTLIFGPPSEPLTVESFATLRPSTLELSPLPSEIAEQCNVSDIRDSLNAIWDDVELMTHLVNSHDSLVSAFHSQSSKGKRVGKKRPAAAPEATVDDTAVAKLQAELDKIPLESWKLQSTSTIFIRPVRTTDQNILFNNKPTRTEDGKLGDNEQQAVLTVTVHNRLSWRQSQVARSTRHLILSSQTLGDLFDAIHCPSTELREEILEDDRVVGYKSDGPPTRPGCVVCVEGMAYGDGESETDYADKLIQHLQAVQKETTVSVKKAPTAMHDTPLSSLVLRIGEPYWLLHHGNCEHVIVVEQIRLQHPSDVQSGYPITTQITFPSIDNCRACNKFPAVWSIVDDERLGESPCFLSMALSSELIESLEESTDIVSWINDTLPPSDSPLLTDLEQQLNQLISTLDLAAEDTSLELERTIDEVSRGVPRLTYDLHFMKDGALSLQSVLAHVTLRSREAVPESTKAALDRLQMLDLVKTRMEAARDVLREAESWSTLELEVTSLLTEKSYAKAAERLSEANKSMAVFQNTPEYDPRKTLMVNLQNQLEAALSSALVAAINIHDLAACRNYFSIFTNIQRESEFRNYYFGSRRAKVVQQWQETQVSDCDIPPESNSPTLAQFMPKFYANFLALLNVERTSIPSIFPDPAPTLSNMINSVLSTLQPTFSQRLASISEHYGDSALKELITVFRSTEEFAAGVDHVMEKIRYSNVLSPMESPSPENPMVHRRRSSRLSMSWRTAPSRSTSSGLIASKSTLSIADELEWEQELFQPFLDFQVDYSTLERRLLDHALREIISSDTRETIADVDRARLLRERTVDVFSVTEESVSRCLAFTHGYGAVGLVRALDGFFQSFIDMWTAEVRAGSGSSSGFQHSTEMADLDYSAKDWADIQLLLHLLSSARAMFDRLMAFETKLRASLVQIATTFRLARNDPTNFVIANSKGESQLLEQSTLNSAELHALLERVDPESAHLRANPSPMPSPPLLNGTREGVYSFAKACQLSLQEAILSPLRMHLAPYASLPIWATPGDPKAKRSGGANELHVPTFSLSPSETIRQVCDRLLDLPRLFDNYADDDALSFSLHTLPHLDPEILATLSELAVHVDVHSSPGHRRRQSLAANPKPPAPLDPEVVSSAWLSSLGHSLLRHFTTTVLPAISTLSASGTAQLASDLGYLSTIVRALNVEYEDLERWKEYSELDDEEGKRRKAEGAGGDSVLDTISRMRGW